MNVAYSGETFYLSKQGVKQMTLKKQRGALSLRIKKVEESKSKSKTWLNNQKFFLTSGASRFATPYQGEITSHVECGKKNSPKDITSLKQKQLVGAVTYFSDQKYMQSTCLNQKISYTTVLAVYYCSPFSYRLKIFAPYTDEKEKVILAFLKDIQC